MADANLLEQAIELLSSKGVIADDEEYAMMQFDRLRDPAKAKLKRNEYEAARQRAIRLVASADTHGECAPEGAHGFAQSEFPGYTTLCMVNDAATLVQRVQHSGLWYMHAGVVVQFYSIWHSARVASPHAACTHGMLDLAKDILARYTPKRLEKHEFENEGGNSVEYLRSILEPGSDIAVEGDATQFADKLARYGPGLVAQFVVHDDFLGNKEQHHHHGLPVGGRARLTFLKSHRLLLPVLSDLVERARDSAADTYVNFVLAAVLPCRVRPVIPRVI